LICWDAGFGVSGSRFKGVHSKRVRYADHRGGAEAQRFFAEGLEAATGVAKRPVLCHDLDLPAGSWRADPEFDPAYGAQLQIDPDLQR